MSRIGNKVIQVPADVTVTVSPENYVVVKGPKGQLEFQFNQNLTSNWKVAKLQLLVQMMKYFQEKSTEQRVPLFKIWSQVLKMDLRNN